MGKEYNWAILGCGKIAQKFSSDLKLLPNAKLYATASRSLEKAKGFANKFDFEVAYGSYEEMVEDPNVDVVYVATPHTFHREHTMLCLTHKKAVLCEKPLAININEVKEMVTGAKENNTFLMEAFWTLFHPSYSKALEIIRSGELGRLKTVRSDFAFNGEYNPNNRLYNIGLGAGSLLDIGIYPVFAAISSLGKPDLVKTLVDFSPTGSEESISMIFKYKDGQMANLSSSFASFSPVQTDFWFEKGYVSLNPQWHTPTTVTIWCDGGKKEMLDSEHTKGWGYQYEAAHVMECLDAGKIESDHMTWQFSFDLMETLDRIRIDAGIFYPGHDGNLFF